MNLPSSATPDRPGPLTPERERWAEAVAVQRMYGEDAALFVAERIEALECAGQLAGVARWREIAARLDQLSPNGVVQ